MPGIRKLIQWSNRIDVRIQETREKAKEQGRSVNSIQEKRWEQEREEAQKIFEERKRWIEEGMRTAADPYLRVAAVLVPQES